jgi:DNA-directed RNA polymerase subunit RPC12/RpoP
MPAIRQDQPKPFLHPRPPSCPKCGSKMAFVSVSPNESRFTNLDLWSYLCDPCGESVSNYVAHQV